MKTLKALRNPDIIEINGEKFQVIENDSGNYDSKKDELGMVISLVKIGEKQMSPTNYLEYIYERPNEMKFFVYDKKKNKSQEQKIDSINF